jgi:hypothetical protein
MEGVWNKSFKECSCGEKFETETAFLKRTQSIGIMSAAGYMPHDFELRNCNSCRTTLTRQVARLVASTGSTAISQLRR